MIRVHTETAAHLKPVTVPVMLENRFAYKAASAVLTAKGPAGVSHTGEGCTLALNPEQTSPNIINRGTTDDPKKELIHPVGSVFPTWIFALNSLNST